MIYKLCVLCLGFCFITNAQEIKEEAPDYSKHVLTIDSTIETLYSVISGEKGEQRNWNLFRYLFHEDAKLIPSGINQENKTVARFMTPEEYISTSGEWLVSNGFVEMELHRETDVYGQIAQVFSTYESYQSKLDSSPFMRGINSIQMLNDGQRWWILNIYWMSENEANPIPESYLPKGE
jgi:uncharacterized protein YfaT (DUF1175 family)